MNDEVILSHLLSAGTVTVPSNKKCHYCEKPNPEMAIRDIVGLHVYHWDCLKNAYPVFYGEEPINRPLS